MPEIAPDPVKTSPTCISNWLRVVHEDLASIFDRPKSADFVHKPWTVAHVSENGY